MVATFDERTADDAGRLRAAVLKAVSEAFEAYDHGFNANRQEMAEHAAGRAAQLLESES